MTYRLIQISFILLTVASYTLLFLEVNKAITLTDWTSDRKGKFKIFFLSALMAWAFFVSVWSISGRMSNFEIFPVNMLPVFAIPFLTIVAFTFSKAGKDILVHIPPENIVRLQAFRFFVELLLWSLFLVNLAPVQMTFEGRNFDVLSGLSAPLIAFLISKRKISTTALIIWNVLCLALLINIVGTAILAMPTSLRTFLNEPANTIVTHYPVSWLPGLLVPLAYGLHFFSLRQLSLKKNS